MHTLLHVDGKQHVPSDRNGVLNEMGQVRSYMLRCLAVIMYTVLLEKETNKAHGSTV